MAAAVADAMLPSPPASRNLAASLARAHGRLAMAAEDAFVRLLLVAAVGDAFLCLSLASAWLLAAGVAAMDVGRVVCGVDCAVVLAGARVLTLAGLSLTIFCTPALLVFVIRTSKADSDTDEAEDPDFEGPGSRSLSAAAEEVLCYPVMLGVLATGPFFLLALAVGQLKGALAIDALYCFIIIPAAALRVWKVTRPGLRCRSDVEKNP